MSRFTNCSPILLCVAPLLALPSYAQTAPSPEDLTSTLLGIALSGSPSRLPDSVVRVENFSDLDTVIKALKGKRAATEEFVWAGLTKSAGRCLCNRRQHSATQRAQTVATKYTSRKVP